MKALSSYAVLLFLGLIQPLAFHEAIAQIDTTGTFVPLQVGNYWEFRLESYTYNGSNDTPQRQPHFHTTQVLGDTLIDGVSHWLLQTHGYNMDLQRICDQRTAYVLNPNGSFDQIKFISQSENVPHGCRTFQVPNIPHFVDTYNFINEADTLSVSIDGVTYPVKALAAYGQGFSGSSGAGAGILVRYAADIGLYLLEYRANGPFNQPLWNVFYEYHLIYARVNGISYGIAPVVTSVEQEPDLSGAFSIYPNPSSNQFTLFIEDVSSNDMFTYEVFDMLGREVQRGRLHALQRQFSVDLTQERSGVYFVRITNGEKVLYSGSLVKLP